MKKTSYENVLYAYYLAARRKLLNWKAPLLPEGAIERSFSLGLAQKKNNKPGEKRGWDFPYLVILR